jgi:hypothetical protein
MYIKVLSGLEADRVVFLGHDSTVFACGSALFSDGYANAAS